MNGLYDLEGKLKDEISNLKGSGISNRNIELILNFQRHNIMRDLSVFRQIKYINMLKTAAVRTKKDFDKVEAKDYEDLVVMLKGLKLSPFTIGTYRAVLKTFHKWLNGGLEYPPCVKWLNGNYSGKRKLPDEMLAKEEIKEMLKHTCNPRDKALISVLWESGARIGEVGNLRIKNATFDEYGCCIMVDGKTGMRRVRLINSAPDLLEWLNKHPHNNDREAFIWVNLEKNRLDQMGHRYIMKMLQVTAKKAGIQKPVNPHNFRHSRATYMSQYLTEAQMKEYFGWTQDSKMAAQYVHLSGKQVDDAILKMHGLIE